MYAQVIEGGTTSEQRGEMDRIVAEQLIPALREEPGYAGALNLADEANGDGLMVVLWQTEEQAERPLSDYGPAFLKALADIVAISTGTRKPNRVWRVNVDDRDAAGLIAVGQTTGASSN